MKITPIKSSLYHLKQDIAHRINPKKCQYLLFDKSKKTDIEQYKKITKSIPQGADSFRTLTIGKRDDNTYRKKITTFYSGEKVIEKLSECSDGQKIIRKYEYSPDKPESNFKNKKIIQKSFDNNSFSFKTDFIEEQNTYRCPDNGKIKLQIKKNLMNGDDIEASITEFPFTGNQKLLQKMKKFICLKIKFDDGIPKIDGALETTNLKISENDKYLPFRFIIDKTQRIIAFTKYFIKEKKLDKLNIKVEIHKNICENTSGYFSDLENRIVYDEKYLNKMVDLSAHEVEHAYQYRQIGRIGKGRSFYERKSLEIYGRIEGLKESMEAHKYAIAAENYPQFKNNENIAKNPEYINNYLEIKAKEAGHAAQNEYDILGKKLGEQFFFGI